MNSGGRKGEPDAVLDVRHDFGMENRERGEIELHNLDLMHGKCNGLKTELHQAEDTLPAL